MVNRSSFQTHKWCIMGYKLLGYRGCWIYDLFCGSTLFSWCSNCNSLRFFSPPHFSYSPDWASLGFCLGCMWPPGHYLSMHALKVLLYSLSLVTDYRWTLIQLLVQHDRYCNPLQSTTLMWPTFINCKKKQQLWITDRYKPTGITRNVCLLHMVVVE